MRRNMVASLFEHETIATTMQKAKEVRPFAEKLITLAKKGTLAARRRAISLLGNRDIIEYEDGRPVRKGTVIGKLFSELGPRYLDRPGGYTRIIRRSLTRLGDSGQLVLLQLIGENEGPKKRSKKGSKRSSRRRAKAAAAVAEVAETKESSGAGQALQAEENQQVEAPDQGSEAQQQDVEKKLSSSEGPGEEERAESEG